MTAASFDATTRQRYARMAADLRRVFGHRFVSLVTSARGTLAAFVTAINPADLDALGPLVEAWHHDELPTPLVMTVDEFRRSLDVFPAEYQALIEHHIVIDGEPPFDGVRIGADDLRRACEVQARGHLIHLRQGWIDSRGDARRLADLMVRSADPFRLVLANLAQLHQEHPADDAALAVFAEAQAGISRDLVDALLGASRDVLAARALVPRLPEYLQASERLWAYVDRWRTA